MKSSYQCYNIIQDFSVMQIGELYVNLENRDKIDHVELPRDIQMLPDSVSWWPLSYITDCGTNNIVAYRGGYRVF